MEKDHISQDEISQYRAQFEKSMATIAAYQAKAEIEMEEFRASMVEFRASLVELRESQKETGKQLREIGKQQKETDKQQKENAKQQKETDKQVKETAKQLKKTHKEFNSNWGRLVESLVRGDLVKLLNARGIDVTGTYPNVRVSYVEDSGGRREKEFDVVVRNGEEVVAVEVKTTLKPKDVKKFMQSMKVFTRFFPDHVTKRVYGAVAYIRCDSEADLYAERQGLYVIRATGDSASIVNAEEFRPRSFSSLASRPARGHLRAVPGS